MDYGVQVGSRFQEHSNVTNNSEKHHRRSIRLKGYDYTQPGAYFVTLVTWQNEALFGEISDGNICLFTAGEVIASCWLRLPAYFSIRLDDWVIMPNHFHAVLLIETPRAGEASARDRPNTGDSPQ